VRQGLWGTQEGGWTSEGSWPGGRRRRKECFELLHYYTTTDTQPSCFFPSSFLQCVHSTTQPRLPTGHQPRTFVAPGRFNRGRHVFGVISNNPTPNVIASGSSSPPIPRLTAPIVLLLRLPLFLQSSLNLEHHERERLQLRQVSRHCNFPWEKNIHHVSDHHFLRQLYVCTFIFSISMSNRYESLMTHANIVAAEGIRC
jgi:hypothetical protein